MECIGASVNKIILCTIAILLCAEVSSSQNHQQSHQHQQNQEQPMNWPVTLTFHETRTNAMLGEALLKRLYARIGFSDNIIRAEVDTLFENLKEVIEKRLRKCERKRRRAGNQRSSPYDSMYNKMNATLANQYTPRDHGHHYRTRSY